MDKCHAYIERGPIFVLAYIVSTWPPHERFIRADMAFTILRPQFHSLIDVVPIRYPFILPLMPPYHTMPKYYSAYHYIHATSSGVFFWLYQSQLNPWSLSITPAMIPWGKSASPLVFLSSASPCASSSALALNWGHGPRDQIFTCS